MRAFLFKGSDGQLESLLFVPDLHFSFYLLMTEKIAFAL